MRRGRSRTAGPLVALVALALVPLLGGCAALAVPVGVAAIAPHLPPASDTSRATHPSGAAVRATLEPARRVAAVGARGDTTWLDATTLVVGTVAHTRGDTLWVALTTQRDVRGETRHWGRRRKALVSLVPGPDVRVARIATNARAGDVLLVGGILAGTGLYLAFLYAVFGGT